MAAATTGALGGCPGGEGYELGAVGDAELGEDVGQVGLHGGAGNEQAAGYVRVGQAFGGELYDLSFGRGEAVPAVARALPRAPAAPGVTDRGLGGQLPGLFDDLPEQ